MVEDIRDVKRKTGPEKRSLREPSSDSLSHSPFCLLDVITRSYEAKYKQRGLVMAEDAHCVQLRAYARGIGITGEPALKKTANEKETDP